MFFNLLDFYSAYGHETKIHKIINDIEQAYDTKVFFMAHFVIL